MTDGANPVDTALVVRLSDVNETAPTAGFEEVPERHDGATVFRLELHFSLEPARLSYKTVGGGLLEVTGARVTGARRLTAGSNLDWEVTVEPTQAGDIVITLPARSCGEANAICIDGKALARAATATVSGSASSLPPVVSIAPSATPVTEGTAVAFTLSRTGATDAALTVAVSVSETGAAVNGTPSTSVTFAAGSDSATLSVATEDDEAVEDASTVTATVSSGTGYTVDGTSGSAEVVVVDDDAAPVVTTASPIEVVENATAVATLAATDADTGGAGLSWSIPEGAAGGADGAKFSLTAAGVLTFKAAKDFEVPDDADTDGDYEVTVRVTDGSNTMDAALVVRLEDTDDTAPALRGASVDGDELTMTFSEALDEGSTPPASSFAVTVALSARGVDAVEVLGEAVTLTLSSAVVPGEPVTVGYTVPTGERGASSKPVQDTAGNPAAAFANTKVRNAAALPVVSVAASTTPVTEGTAAVFTLTRTGATDAALTVDVSVTETGAAVSGTSPTSVTLAAGSDRATLSVATEDDEVAEDASTVTATVSSGTGYTVSGTAGSADVVVNDDDAAPVVTTASPIEVVENATAVVTLAATDADTGAAGLSWSIPEGAAGGVDGAKFSLTATGVLTFKAAKDFEAPDDANTDGEYEVTVRVTDGANPVDTALVVVLRQFSTYCSDLGLAGSGRCNRGPVTISVTDNVVATEGIDATVDFEVSLSHPEPYGRAVTMDWSIVEDSSGATAGEDYTDANGTLIFSSRETTKTVRIALLDDSVSEGIEAFRLRLTNASRGTFVWYGEERSSLDAKAWILPDEDTTAPTMTIATQYPVTPPVTGWVNVIVQFSEWVTGFGRSDVNVTNGVVTSVSPDRWLNDKFDDYGAPRWKVTVEVATDFAGDVSISVPDGVVTDWSGNGNTASETFTIAARGASSQGRKAYVSCRNGPDPASWTGTHNVSVDFGFGQRLGGATPEFNPGDYVITTEAGVSAHDGAIMICTGPDQWQYCSAAERTHEGVSGTLSVQVLGGAITSDGRPSRASDPLYVAGNPWTVSAVDARATRGTDTNIEFGVSLNGRDDCRRVTVDWATADGTAVAGTDYTSSSGTLTFEPGETTKTVRVPLLSSSKSTGDKTLSLRLSNVTGHLAGLGSAEAAGTIAGSALPLVSIAASTTPVTEGTEASFTLSRTGATDAELTVDVSVTESGASVSGTPTTSVTLVAGSDSATLSVATEDDEVSEDASTVTATVSSGAGYTVDDASDSAEVVVEDDDAAPVVTTASLIVVAENTTVVVTLAATDEDTAVEDLSWSIPEAEAGGADAAQFALTADGVLTFQAAKDYESPDDADTDGDYEVTVRVTDGANPLDVPLVVRLEDADDAAPVLSSASVDGATLTLTFDEALDGDSVPEAVSFAVTVTGSSRTVDSVVASGSAVTLTLSAAVTAEDTVTVGYTVPVDPEAAALQDAAGNPAAAFANSEVTNRTAARPGVGQNTCGDTGDHASRCNDPEGVMITVSDAEVAEGPGATLDFVVTLSHAHSIAAVTMDYRILDWNVMNWNDDHAAVAGEDYTDTRGTLTIPQGQTTGTVSIAVIDDAVSEGVKTLDLNFSNASKATFVRHTTAQRVWTAQGTIIPDEDTTAPTVTIRAGSLWDGFSLSEPVSGPFKISLVFSEPVEGVVPSDLKVTNGSVSMFSKTTSLNTWSAQIEPDDGLNGNVSIRLPAGIAADRLGNTHTASNTLVVAARGASTSGPKARLVCKQPRSGTWSSSGSVGGRPYNVHARVGFGSGLYATEEFGTDDIAITTLDGWHAGGRLMLCSAGVLGMHNCEFGSRTTEGLTGTLVMRVLAGAITDEQGRPSRASDPMHIAGNPWMVSVSDATATEGTDDTIDFEVPTERSG